MKIQIEDLYVVTYKGDSGTGVYKRLFTSKEEAEKTAKQFTKGKVHSNIFINKTI
jgi:hypothetical protein